MMKGEANMESSITATMSWEKSCPSNATDCAWTMSTRPNSRAGGGSEQACQRGDQPEFERDQQSGQRGHQRKAGRDRPEVESHAYGDEEQVQQHLAKRPDVLL